jgi:raffinose/stachyose/melibiose transport system permease protein
MHAFAPRRRPGVDPVLVGTWIALLIAAVAWMIPLLFMIFTSLKSRRDLVQGGPFDPPSALAWDNFRNAWETGQFSTYGVNSLLIAFVKVPAGIFVAALAAFALSRLRFRYQKALLLLFVMGTMIPIQVALGPIFRLVLDAGLLDTYLGLLLPYIAFGLPYQIFLLYGFFKQLPRELDESAAIDGASKFGLYFRIVLPLSLPILAALFILDFVATWNEFAIALVILTSSDSWTVPLGLMGFRGQFGTDYGALNAAILISIIPVVLVYLLFQRYFVSGLTAGAVKG